MKRIIGVVALVAALFSVSQPAMAGQGSGQGYGPLTGTITGSVDFVPEVGCQPVDLETQGTGSGIVSRLGRVTMTSLHCTPPPGVDIDGRRILIAANGDELYIDYAGPCSPIPPDAVPGVTTSDCETPVVIAGGTGRFEDATGTGHLSAVVTFLGFGIQGWPVTWDLSARVRY